jgi:hypothetical protein
VVLDVREMPASPVVGGLEHLNGTCAEHEVHQTNSLGASGVDAFSRKGQLGDVSSADDSRGPLQRLEIGDNRHLCFMY